MRDRFADVPITVPPSVVIGTDVFDEFLEMNDLRDFVVNADDEQETGRRFMASDLPETVMRQLAALLDIIRYPLAVRSSIPPWGASSRPETAPPRAIRGSLPAPFVLPVGPAATLVPMLLRTRATATSPTAVTVTRRSPATLGRCAEPARMARAIEMLRRRNVTAAAERWP